MLSKQVPFTFQDQVEQVWFILTFFADILTYCLASIAAKSKMSKLDFSTIGGSNAAKNVSKF